MTRSTLLAAIFALTSLAVGCTDGSGMHTTDTGPGPIDSGRGDAGSFDAGAGDANRPDTGITPVDSGGMDAATGLDAFVATDAFVPPDAFVAVDAFAPPDGGTSGCELTSYPTLRLVAVSGTFRGPVAVVAVPGSTDLYVVEHRARIQIMHADGSNGGVFLDLTSVAGGATGSSEQGLLGLAFHPGYATNGLFYVYYAPVGGSTNVVAVGHRSAANPNAADPTVTPILTLTGDLYPNHNGGNLVFGPDGLLYIGTGDGGSGGDPQMHGQDTSTLYGKILRIRVDPTITTYQSPATNPFAAGGGLPEIYAYGLRNPWRFSFDRLTGALFIGDVGQNLWEEVSVDTDAMGGDNYGWNVCEGTHNYGGGNCAALTPRHAPIFEYSHSGSFFATGGSASISGGVVYRGSAIPALWGTYLFAEEVTSQIGGFRYCGGIARDPHVFTEVDGTCANPASFGEDAAGNVYVACVFGNVMRIVSP